MIPILGKNLILPSRLRKKLKKPLGEVVSNLEKSTLKGKKIICVGDKVSERILNLGIFPKICLYDGKTGRKKIGISPVIKNFKAQEVRVKNPAGKLTKAVFQKIADGLKAKERTKIQVEGEEDLSTLAAIHLSPLNFIVIYGQPNQGLVIVKVNEKIKNKVKRILEEMENEN